eukprot:GILJ01006976.1.p1 GENE.GILJ01006976.1~~GILJ01006976.1.p1  ORF type:complete len:547 (+),score=60.93 GILJ01006976.1:1113-2753(+)
MQPSMWLTNASFVLCKTPARVTPWLRRRHLHSAPYFTFAGLTKYQPWKMAPCAQPLRLFSSTPASAVEQEAITRAQSKYGDTLFKLAAASKVESIVHNLREVSTMSFTRKVKFQSSPEYATTLSALPSVLPQATARQFAFLVSVLGSIGLPSGEASDELLHRLYSDAFKHLPKMAIPELRGFMQGAAWLKLLRNSNELSEKTIDIVNTHINSLSVSAVCDIILSFAQAGVTSARAYDLYRTAFRQIIGLQHLLYPEDIQKAVGAFVKVDLVPETLPFFIQLIQQNLAKAKLTTIVNWTCSLSKATYYVPSLYSDLCFFIEHRMEPLNSRDYSMFLWAITHIGHGHEVPQFIEKYLTSLLEMRYTIDPQHLCLIAWCCAILRVKDPAIWTFLKSRVELSPESKRTNASQIQLLQADLYLRLFLDSSLLFPEVRERHLRAVKPVDSSEDHRDVSRTITALGVRHVNEYIIEDLFIVDIAIPEKKIAIEVAGPQHYRMNSETLLAPSMFKIMMLNRLGWKIVYLPVRDPAAVDKEGIKKELMQLGLLAA